ncbi:MAG: SpoIIE family protein phosphatase [Dokdonella sp.]|uniref:SpoIIE family protein phosphatase n=1 Tax=Dokdonella sp. TaxID=2291710 RepID=UPI0032675D52
MRTRLRGLRGRFLLIVIAIYVLVGVLSLVGFYRVAETIIRQLGGSYATQYANQQRGRITARVDRELVLTQKLVASPLLRNWANDESNTQLARESLEELESFRVLFADHSWFFVVGKSGDYYHNNAANEFGGREFRFVMDPSDRTMAWYFDVLKNVDDFNLHVDYDAQLDVTKIFINAIVKNNGAKIGIGGTGLDLSEFVRTLMHTTERGIENVLIDDQGYVQGISDRALMETIARTTDATKRPAMFAMMDRDSEQSTLRQILGRMRAGQIEDAQAQFTIRGQSRLAAISYMPELHWAAVVLVDPGEVIRLETFRPILFLMATALLLTILLVSWLLDRLVLTRLARLTDATRSVAAGQYDRRMTVDRDDEIGQLAHSFNAMTSTIGDYMQNLEHKVSERTDALQQANALLGESNRKVMDSIGYAQLIQSSILAKPDEIARFAGDHAVLWRPRDVVGGDFYTVHRDADGGALVAVADCTGHGVPGAFMTMASKAILDSATARHGLADPAALIGELHRGLRALLQSHDTNNADNGLDIALLYVAPARNRLVFAGAKLALWILAADGSISVVKGDRLSAGYRRIRDDVRYANHDVVAHPGERYILSSDGIFDQNGGEKGFAFGQTRVRDVLSSLIDRPLAQLFDALAVQLDEYRGDLPQRDDITLFGFSLDAGRAPPWSN